MASEQRDGRAGPRAARPTGRRGRRHRRARGPAASPVPGWYQTSRGVEPSARTAVPALLSSAMFSFVQAGPRPATTVAGVGRSGVELHHGRAEGGVRGGLVGWAVVRGEHEARACARGVVGQHVATVPGRHHVVRAGDLGVAPRRRGRCRPRRERLDRQPEQLQLLALEADEHESASRPGGVGEPGGGPRRRGRWGHRRTRWSSASGRAASSASIDRTTSTSTPCWRSTSASALAPSGPVPSGSRSAVGRCADRASSTTSEQPQTDHAQEGGGAAHPVPVPAPRPAPGRVGVSSGGAHRGPAVVAGSGSTGRVRARSASSAMTSRADSGRGRAPPVAHGVEGVRSDGERRGGCREHRPQRDRHLVRGAAGQVVEQGALDGGPGERAVGLEHRGVGVAGLERAAGSRPVLGSGAGGAVEHALAARARHPALGVHRAHRAPGRRRPR